MEAIEFDLPDGPVIITPNEEVPGEMVDDSSDLAYGYFQGFLHEVKFLMDDDDLVNDVSVVCEGGEILKLPAVVVAALCPVFSKEASSFHCMCETALILPEVKRLDLDAFICKLFVWRSNQFDGQDSDIIDLIGIPFKNSVISAKSNKDPVVGESKKRKKPGRKLGSKMAPFQPDFKVVETETPRAKTSYSLRNKIKRRKFVGSKEPFEEDDARLEDSEEEFKPETFVSDEESVNLDHESMDEDELEEGENLDEENLLMYTVKRNPDVNAQVIGEEKIANELPKHGRMKRFKDESGKVIAVGKVVPVFDGHEDTFIDEEKFKSIENLVSNSKSLSKFSDTPIFLLCSVCSKEFQTMHEIKHHAAQQHKGSKFFQFAENNPHQDCVKCKAMIRTYEETTSQGVKTMDICFPCPHCRRRYMGSFSGLANHLHNDHQEISSDLGAKSEAYFSVYERGAVEALTCEFCKKTFSSGGSLNSHLMICLENVDRASAGLPCSACGKKFAHIKYLRSHMKRHEAGGLEKNIFCYLCPGTFSTELSLNRHLEKDHGGPDPDEKFVLHEGCERCDSLMKSYISNKTTKAIRFGDMVFQCPHCFMLIKPSANHAPKYLSRHIQDFHLDPEINIMTLDDSIKFELKSIKDGDVFKCPFCDHFASSRNSLNIHLTTCKSNNVPTRPGYLCKTCGFIAGTSYHLKSHMETHNLKDAFKCDLCAYRGKSKRYLNNHMKMNHRSKDSSYVPCPKCGKMRKEGQSMKCHVKKCGLGPAKVACPDCAMEFKRDEDMQAHSVIHYGQVICPVHNILFKSENEVFKHVNKADAGEKLPKLQCCFCDRTFKHMCLFMRHLRQHLRISPYQCKLCSKHVGTYASLKMHMSKVHNPSVVKEKVVLEKRFHCDKCDKSFGTSGHLKEHNLGVHERTAVVCCPVCQKAFNTRKRMRKHFLNSHKDQEFNRVENISYNLATDQGALDTVRFEIVEG